MKTFLVERYLPGVTAGQLEAAAARLARASAELSASGVPVKYLGSTVILEEESCLSRFEGERADDVRRACEHAGVAFARIVETRDLSSGEGEP